MNICISPPSTTQWQPCWGRGGALGPTLTWWGFDLGRHRVPNPNPTGRPSHRCLLFNTCYKDLPDVLFYGVSKEQLQRNVIVCSLTWTLQAEVNVKGQTRMWRVVTEAMCHHVGVSNHRSTLKWNFYTVLDRFEAVDHFRAAGEKSFNFNRLEKLLLHISTTSKNTNFIINRSHWQLNFSSFLFLRSLTRLNEFLKPTEMLF